MCEIRVVTLTGGAAWDEGLSCGGVKGSSPWYSLDEWHRGVRIVDWVPFESCLFAMLTRQKSDDIT